MGKKNKLFKSGLTRNSIKKTIHEQNKINKNIISNDKDENMDFLPNNEDNNIKENIINQNVSVIQYNKMKFDKANETLGLDENDVNDLLLHPIRTRRNVNNRTFTKREKKKIEREERKERLKHLT
jgi:hypothetical protein